MKRETIVMTFDKIIQERRSIRRYKPDPLTNEQLTAILDAGNKAPSAKNLQHWRFHVFLGEAKKEFTTFCLDMFDKKANEPDVHPYARYSFKIMEEAPIIVLVYTAQKMDHPSRPDIQSVAAAIQNMLLKAYELGLGSLWICDVLYIDELINEHLEIDMQLIAAVTFGYPDENPKDRRKLSVESVTTWHK
ncbi:MAG: hypothetical protein GF308_10800 [Candidatus Heimdallarchaeota archaeon]|nr:hypothetical protein [Candidatus Heimdallarchaeota archaeon]